MKEAMKEQQFLAPKPRIIIYYYQAWVLLEVLDGAPSCWNEKSPFLKCSFVSCKAGAKMSLMYTFVLTLASCFTKIRGYFQVFETEAQTMTDAGFNNDDKRLTCLQQRPVSVWPALFCFVD